MIFALCKQMMISFYHSFGDKNLVYAIWVCSIFSTNIGSKTSCQVVRTCMYWSWNTGANCSVLLQHNKHMKSLSKLVENMLQTDIT